MKRDPEEFEGFHPQVTPSREQVAGTDVDQELASCRHELRELRQELEKEREARQRDRDRLVRQVADLDNARKRHERSAGERGVADRKRILRTILPVADNLERALHERSTDVAALRHGIEIVHRQLEDTLRSLGAVRVSSVNAPFDPQRHEAVGVEHAVEKSGCVIREIEAGYMLDGELLRPARVVVGECGEPRQPSPPVEQPEGVSEPVEGP